jgi:hypothetical protein
MGLIDCITKGRRKESIMHAPRIRAGTAISVLNPPMAENREPDED